MTQTAHLRAEGLICEPRHLARDVMEQNICRAAAGFLAMGIGKGDSIALFMRNDFPFIEASIAAQRIGAYAVPVNWHFKAEEVAYVLGDCDARVLIVHADMWPAIASGVAQSIAVIVVATPFEIGLPYRAALETFAVPAGMTDWTQWLASHAPVGELPAPATESMIYTSGTTGNPKAVRRSPATPEQTGAVAKLRASVYGMRAGMVALVPGPLYHSAPNSFALRSALVGQAVIMMPRFDGEEMLALIERYRITHMFAVPTMFVRLLKLPESVRKKYDLSSLEFIIHAAAPCPPDVKHAMIEWWGPIIHEFYGSTESGPVSLSSSEDFLRKPGTVGRATEGCELLILDDDGAQVATGMPGEIFSRISYYPDFTYHKKEEKRAEIDRGGFITSGDIGYLDEDGFLFICDRKRDMVISGGVNIYPAEIEACILSLDGVKDCAVFGVPDAEFGEALMAIVEPQSGADITPAMARTHMLSHLAAYKVPKHIKLGYDLPREDSGKIFKRRLRDPYWAQAGRTI